jgi:membrane protein YdbS with pleckstrin-like domain
MATYPTGGLAGGDPPAAWLAPSPRLRSLRRAEVAVVGGIVVVAGGLAFLALSDVAAIAFALGVLVLTVVADFVAGRRVRAWAFAERQDDLVVRRGLMFRRLSVIPYGRMQFVEVTAGPLERSFGLATVQMHTAAAASDARIPGLEAAEAARIRDQLTALGESRAAGL